MASPRVPRGLAVAAVALAAVIVAALAAGRAASSPGSSQLSLTDLIWVDFHGEARVTTKPSTVYS